MRNRKIFSLISSLMLLVATTITVFQASSASAANPNCTAVDGDYIVTFNRNANVKAEVNGAPGKSVSPKFIYDSALNGFAASLSAEQACAFAKRPNIESIELDQIVQNQNINVQNVNSAIWSLDRLDSKTRTYDSRYTYTSSGSGVNAYIVDTGINTSHTEFTGRITSPGFTAVDGTIEDCNGHGTHVAGTIGGNTYGVAKMVNLIPVRVLGCNGSGTNSGVIAGLNWISTQLTSTPSVVNMSLGGGISSALDSAVTNLTSKGVTVVVAAGNSRRDACNFSPSRVPSAVTVAASDRNDQFASFSNFGKCVDLIAPGVSITSAWINSATASNSISGTSMASPHVAGAIARYISSKNSISFSGLTTPNVVVSVPRGTSNLLLYVDPAK